MIITVVCREDGFPNSILIYAVDVDPKDQAAVLRAVQAERNMDLGEEMANDMEILFAFEGNLSPTQDWREE